MYASIVLESDGLTRYVTVTCNKKPSFPFRVEAFTAMSSVLYCIGDFKFGQP